MVIKNMIFKPVTTLSEALSVRQIRNECRKFLTNYTGYISIPRQTRWYLTYYKQAARAGIYRIFIARDGKGVPVGYGALKLDDGELLVTECVAEKYRGRGYGRKILKKLITIAKREGATLVAEIRTTNIISVALHKKCGFTLDKNSIKSGIKLCIYKLVN
jgi:RimJ/RimL family protein N-acetyltransferase